ncbi:MAG: TonB-dependent receptor [Rhodothermales bacterium]|nr:TonB-dependent receptor [Rhodothermales bacterium]MBO6779276.1 TonB-dependent receptor [Rhodothermales bacterium]
MLRRLLLFSVALLVSQDVFAQSIPVTGRVVSADDGQPLAGVNVAISPLSDSTRVVGEAAGADGRFRVMLREPGVYRIRITFVGFEPALRVLSIPEEGRELDTVRLEVRAVDMDDVVVEAVQDRVVVRGDTTEYAAGAYQVNPDANAEDLLAKMPGVVVRNGQVEAGGEQVRRVLVDGREFFGDDPTAALRNLPSEVIDKIQVFERMSDQAQFTGFDDGNGEMTINIITRADRRNGQFGKVYGGYGSEDRYQGGGNVNMFDDTRRISIIGMSNNVNQQNFSTEDLLGVVGQAGGRGGFSGGPRGGGARGGRGGGGGDRGGFRGGGGNARDFMIGDQGGVNRTNSIGINYSDEFGDAFKMTGSYFFNQSENTTANFLDREYFLDGGGSQFYDESNDAASDNMNHRLSMRMEYTINERNSIIFTPRLSAQMNDSQSFVSGLNTDAGGGLLSETVNDFLTENSGWNGSANLLLRHRFTKRGRTLSLNLTGRVDDRSGETRQASENVFYDGTAQDASFSQLTDNLQSGYTVATSLVYTEPAGERGQIQVSYRPSFSMNDADRLASMFDIATGGYTVPAPALSSRIDNEVLTQRAGVSYRLRMDRGFFSAGLSAQTESLTGDQALPRVAEVDKSFTSLLPQVMFMIGDRRTNNLRLFYRTSTNTPSITQLQDVVDNSNPLQLSSGNPDLEQSYSHNLVARFNKTSPRKGRVFIGFVSFQAAQNFVGSETIVAATQTRLDNGLVLAPGSQYTRPVNLDGYWNARSFFTLGTPIGPLSSNLNLNGGLSVSNTPGLVNGQSNDADVQVMTAGATLGSNISERVDFTLTHESTFNTIRNSVSPELDSDYVQHTSGVRMNLMPSANWVLESSFAYRAFDGLEDSIDNASLLLNAGLGYKFLQGNGGELRFAVVDILNQQTSVGRSVNSFYVDDMSSNVLGRYVMLNFTYTLRNYRF